LLFDDGEFVRFVAQVDPPLGVVEYLSESGEAGVGFEPGVAVSEPVFLFAVEWVVGVAAVEKGYGDAFVVEFPLCFVAGVGAFGGGEEKVGAVDDRAFVGDCGFPAHVRPFCLADGGDVFIGECCGAEVALEVLEVERELVVGDVFGGVVAVAFVGRNALDDAFAELGEGASVDDFALPERVFYFEAAEEVSADVLGVDVVAEDDVEVDFVPAGVGAAERVESEFDDGEDEVDVGKIAALVFGLDDFVPFDGDVVVDAEGFDGGWELAELVEVGVPSFRCVAAGVLVLE
jgi:hypothetical protein